jgi:hypothetical protein
LCANKSCAASQKCCARSSDIELGREMMPLLKTQCLPLKTPMPALKSSASNCVGQQLLHTRHAHRLQLIRRRRRRRGKKKIHMTLSTTVFPNLVCKNL